MPYYELYYHIVWATKHREPLLTVEVEPIIYQYLRFKAYRLEAVVHAMNGVEDHVHMVVTIPPKMAVAKFIGQVKGVASTKFNQRFPHKRPFFWQAEYAAFSFDKKRLPYIIAYVERQKEHHAARTLIPVLERTEGEEKRPYFREDHTIYLPDYERWFREMSHEDPAA